MVHAVVEDVCECNVGIVRTRWVLVTTGVSSCGRNERSAHRGLRVGAAEVRDDESSGWVPPP